MNSDHHKSLLRNLARLDRLEAEVNEIIADPADTDDVPRAEELRELLVEWRTWTEEKLDRVTEP
jgi:hypothetical protein